MRDILAAMRAMLGELKLAPHDWPTVINAIASALNEAPLPRLGQNTDKSTRSPLQVMTGIRPRRVALRILQDSSPPFMDKSLTRARTEQLIQINKLQEGLDALHKDVSDRIGKRRKRAIAAHNRATNIVAPQFAVGDFVLVRRQVTPGHKLAFQWCGPRRITATLSPLVYAVARLDGGREERVHAARLTHYSSAIDGKEVAKEVLDLAKQSESRYEVVDAIVDIGDASDGLFFRVRWDGLPDEQDFTWHPIQDLYDDIPDMVLDYLMTSPKTQLATQAKQQLGVRI